MSDHIRQRLLNGALPELTSLAIDHLLAQPMSTLINAPSLARQIVATLRQAAQSEETDAWLRTQIEALQSQEPGGTMRMHLPEEVLAPIHTAVTHPFTPSRPIVGKLVEHGAVEGLLRELLVGALQGFTKKLRPSSGGGERATSRLRSLKRVSEGMLGGLGAEIERQAEQKAKEFVDSILSSVVAQAADDLCDPAKAESYGRFRGHLLDQLLDTPLAELNVEARKIDPDTWVNTASAIATALAGRKDLETEVVTIIDFALSTVGDQTAADLLDDAGIADAWRQEVETSVNALAIDFVKTPEFSTWLSDLLSD